MALWDWFRKNPRGAPLLVLPTGAGKSILLAEIARKVAERGKRVLILAHRSELLLQNYEKLSALMPWGDIGLYSAGLGRRQASAQVVVAGIQSVHKRAEELGSFALVLVDEVHLVPPDGEGRYRTLISGLTAVNPAIRFAGTSATPYRLGSGVLTTTGDLWTEIAYEITVKELIVQGYLSPLVSKGGCSRPKLATLAVRGGEYVADQMERAFNRLDLVEAAVEEIVAFGEGRKSWLIFSSGVAHAEAIAAVLNRVGIPTGVVTGDTGSLFREQTLADFKAGRLRALVNCEVLTTGFDHPGIDLIAVLRATKSTGLWVQICGRGCRKAEGKENCLVLDYGENAATHGPIDRISITRRFNPMTGKDESRVDTLPSKECPECRSVIALGCRVCPDCCHPLPDIMRLNHKAEASTAPIISQPEPVHEVAVIDVLYKRHQGRDKPLPTLKASYSIAGEGNLLPKTVDEWVCFEHEGLALRKAVQWWRLRSEDPTQDYPDTIEEALDRRGELRRPKRLAIQRDGRWWRVVKVLEFYRGGEEEPENEEAELAVEMGNI